MPSILFWSGQPGGTAEYRCLAPGRALRRLGWDVQFDEDGVDVTAAGRVRGDPDVVVFCRVMGDYVPDAVRRIRRYGRTLVVYDTDDWFAGIPGYNPASEIPSELVLTMHQAMREADLITCSTPELAEGYGVLNRTVVLPNYLAPEIWKPYQDLPKLRSHVHVGWAGGFHWRAGDLELLKPWLYDFLDKHREVRFAAIGCRELLEWLGIDGVSTPQLPPKLGRTSYRNKNLHPYEHLPAMLANLDIGLVPLVHNRFNQGKSWCKGMEYGAMGVPAVASPSREYRKFIRPGMNGLLVRSANWAKQVEAVMRDLDRYREGARKVAEEYWIDSHVHKWVNAYEQAKKAKAA
jgi:glycosyltransferase involved in cell wall biosynthesis